MSPDPEELAEPQGSDNPAEEAQEQGQPGQQVAVVIDKKTMQAMQAVVESFIAKLDRKALDQVAKKRLIEDRWLEDLRAYHGRYDRDEETRLKNAKKSRLFVSLTRSKTHAWEARLADMLFPTDDKNWGIEPTPVPELSEGARQAADKAAELAAQATQQHQAGDQQGGIQTAMQAQVHATAAEQAQAELDEARKRAAAMERQIEDQLDECDYSIRCREVIHDGCKLGTGVMLGPVTAARTQRSWQKVTDQGGQTQYALVESADPRPEYTRVDPWNFFPDMNARRPDEWEFTFQRHLYGEKEMRKLAQRPDFDADAIRDLLEQGAKEAMPDYVVRLREITDTSPESLEPKFVVWRYDGPMETEDAKALAMAMGQSADDVDPLDDHNVVLWFCDGKLLKFGPHPLDSGDSLYSLFNFEQDDASVWGYGVPYLMRDSQKAANGAWRMMMDNGGLSAGPQIVVNREAIQPADGDWTITGKKVWLRSADAPNGVNPFEVHNIDSHQAELAAVVKMAMEFADIEADMPEIAAGDAGSHATRTAQGLTILMNSANVVFRRVVKNFDDELTTPNIQRIYEWNMQFSSKDEIKGDYCVQARGSSVLLVKEMQAQNLAGLLGKFANDPEFGPMLRKRANLRALFQCYMLPADQHVKSDEELDAQDQAKAQAAQNHPDPASAALQVEQQKTQIHEASELKIKAFDRETALMLQASKMNESLDALKAKLADNQATRDHKERIFAADAALKERTGSGLAPVT